MKARFESPLGTIVMEAVQGSIVGVDFVDGEVSKLEEDVLATVGDEAVLVDCREQLRDYFAGRRRIFQLKLAPRGTRFQLRVWQALQQIPYGATSSYSELATLAGMQANRARAIGGAMHNNPIGIILPCHRIVGKNGQLTGYASGLARKQALLALEARVMKAEAAKGLFR